MFKKNIKNESNIPLNFNAVSYERTGCCFTIVNDPHNACCHLSVTQMSNMYLKCFFCICLLFDCLLFVDESGREELYFLWNCCFKNLKVKRPYTSFCSRYSISTLNWNNLTLVTHWRFFSLQKNPATTKWDIALWPTATKSTKTAHEWCSTRPK